MEVLGIDVGPGLFARWAGWLAPPAQPFFSSPDGIRSATSGELTAELVDTFKVWRIKGDRTPIWLDEPAFMALEPAARRHLVRRQLEVGRGAVGRVRDWVDILAPEALRAQQAGGWFLWWPSLLGQAPNAALGRFVATGELASRHREVPRSIWASCRGVLPGAEKLAGTFPPGSGPNCFGTVMAAAGVPAAEDVWMDLPPFEAWLNAATGVAGDDATPGTVLVWRDRSGAATHSAVAIGGGWGLEKPSQGWSAPRVILPISEIKRVNRARGRRLERRHILTA